MRRFTAYNTTRLKRISSSLIPRSITRYSVNNFHKSTSTSSQQQTTQQLQLEQVSFKQEITIPPLEIKLTIQVFESAVSNGQNEVAMETFAILEALNQEKHIQEYLPIFLESVSIQILKHEDLMLSTITTMERVYNKINDLFNEHHEQQLHKDKATPSPILKLVPRVEESMMRMYIKLENIEKVLGIVSRFNSASLFPSYETTLQLLKLFVQYRQLVPCQVLFNSFMESAESTIRPLLYVDFANAFSEMGCSQSTRTVYNSMIHILSNKQIKPINMDVLNQVLKAYIIENKEDKASETLTRIKKDSQHYLHATTYNAMMEAYLRKGDIDRGLEILLMMREDYETNMNAMANTQNYLTISQLYAKKGNVEMCKQVAQECKSTGFDPVILDFIVDAYMNNDIDLSGCYEFLDLECSKKFEDADICALIQRVLNYAIKMYRNSDNNCDLQRLNSEYASKFLTLLKQKKDKNSLNKSLSPDELELTILVDFIKRDIEQAISNTKHLLYELDYIPSSWFMESWFALLNVETSTRKTIVANKSPIESNGTEVLKDNNDGDADKKDVIYTLIDIYLKRTNRLTTEMNTSLLSTSN